MPSRNTIEVVIKAKDEASSGLDGIATKIESVGSRVKNAGAGLTMLMAPVALGLGLAARSALAFDTAMTNVGSVLGKSRTEMAGVSTAVLKIGTDSQFGATATAEAMYEIASGVTDVSTHMAILEAAVALATAGNADLASSTNAMIDIMNSYGYSAEQAGFASDVLTRAVGMGKGSMGEFAAALPGATGLAASLGISFEDVGSAVAYMTTKGVTASTAVTQLTAMMVAMLNPNETMKKGLDELGYSSGEAAIQALGLTGAYEALKTTNTANTLGMSKMTGSVEALKGVTALATPAFQTFAETFKSGIDGATASAAALQSQGFSQQLATMASQVETLGINVGTALLPILIDLANTFIPILTSMSAWITANPEATRTILLVVGALIVLGPALVAVGSVISAVGTIWGALSAAWALGPGIMALISSAGTVMGGVFTTLAAANATANAGFLAMGTSAMAAVPGILALIAPIAAIGAAIIATIAAAKTLLDMLNQLAPVANDAAGAVAGAVASGAVTPDQARNTAFAAAQAEFGGGFLGDLIARGTYQAYMPVVEAGINLGGRAAGGPVRAGTQYMVGEHRPEVFVPEQNGTIMPTGGMGSNYTINMTVPAEIATNPAAMNNANGFAEAVGQRLAMRGG